PPAWEAPSAYAEGPGARRAPGPGDDGETGSARRRLLLELEPGCIRNALLHPGPDHPQVFFLLEVRLLEALHEVVVPHRARQVDESQPTIAVGELGNQQPLQGLREAGAGIGEQLH